MYVYACCVVSCVQGLDALDAGKPVVEAVSRAVKELEVIGITTKYICEHSIISVYYCLQYSVRSCAESATSA